ncbi:hypothetical protein KZX46_01995 (plasmid) [Polymorphobacter sp. PAMC 29334]|uniref:hypothetical protein n=1 Tax=Polymorphobacter sp. PAMC 29334 TaxID=2862331 RepID=UPI001C7675CC|nr:hypothetical protein [Polymorphobacter sp. PAMC 29334]QYE32946.1 hypothetical protein KZX46_01995 [Polymorphobacter sp. PAMC 29334]
MAAGLPDPSHAVLQAMRSERLLIFSDVVLDGNDPTTGRIECTAQIRVEVALGDRSGPNRPGIDKILQSAGTFRLIPADGFPDHPVASLVTYTLQPSIADAKRVVFQVNDKPDDVPLGEIAPAEGTVASALAIIALARTEAATHAAR